MKKINLILLILLTSNTVFSQSAYYKKVSVKDSLYSAAGTLRINANAYYLDGVLQSFGGGSAFDLTAFHLWSGINRFTDGTYFTDSVNITGRFIAQGTLIDSLVATALKSGTIPDARYGSNIPRTDTRDSFTKKVTIDTLTVQRVMNVSNATLTGFSRDTSISDANYTIVSGNKFVSIGSITATRVFALPPASTIEKGYEIIICDRSGSLSAAKKLIVSPNGADVINGTTADTLITPYAFRRYVSDGTSKWNYDGGLARLGKENTFTKVITFLLSPVFSALVNFANGITVTGTATFNGYTSLGDSATAIKTKLIKYKLGGSTNTYYPSPNHGIRANRVTNWSVIAKDSATKQIFPMRYNLVTADYYAMMTDTNFQVYLNTGNTYLLSDSVFFTISYFP